MMFIGEIEKGEKVKYIQANSTTSKKLGIISEKDFMVEDTSSKDDGAESDSEEGENFEDESKADF